MAAIDGTWNIVAQTPMGEQKVTAVVSTSGSELTGTVNGGLFGSAAIEDGRIDGDRATWTIKVSSPLQMTLKHEATFSGDTVSGEIDTGVFGKAPFSGARA